MVEIDLAAIDQDEQARAEGTVIAPDADIRGAACAPAQDVDARSPGKDARNVGRPGPADVVSGDDLHRDRRLGGALGRAGGRGGDGLVEHLLQRAIVNGLGVRGLGENEGRNDQGRGQKKLGNGHGLNSFRAGSDFVDHHAEGGLEGRAYRSGGGVIDGDFDAGAGGHAHDAKAFSRAGLVRRHGDDVVGLSRRPERG